jgi:predicted homoserine dehydrogenase-like protein
VNDSIRGNTRAMNPTLSRTTSQPIRAAIVGTGYIAEFHALAILALQGVELVSVCDINLRRFTRTRV